MKLKKLKAKTYNIIVSYLLVLMMLINANLAAFIINDHKADIKAELLRFASLKSLTSAFIENTTEFFTEDAAGFAENAIAFSRSIYGPGQDYREEGERSRGHQARRLTTTLT